MSLALSQIEIQQFLSEAHAEFQSEGFLLQGAVRTKSGTKGSIVHFPVFGEGMANQKAPQDDITPMNVSSRDAEAVIEDWYASEYADRSFQNKLAVNAVEEYAKLCAWAIGRRADQINIDTIAGATYSATPNDQQGALVPVGTTGFTFEKLRQAHRWLRQRSANRGKRTVIIDAIAEEQLLNVEQLTNSFYVNQKILDNDGLHGMTFLGMNFIVIPSMQEGGLPTTGGGTVGRAFFINEMAVGYAQSERLGGDISWENIKTSYLINMWMEAGAVVIDPKGLVEVDYLLEP
ncbi:phage capsid protein [Legionella pneumophila]|uniref:phage capsid protein n=1 Tax=Legionella pneumophila TaxID=446 RepID=UPI002243AD1F|nr:phage capsid protein [Legionella pneumophila]MCW8457413.1 phage capsid protein [Legionella pneumophila]